MEKLGFKAVIQSGVILHVQDALEVNFEMMLGSASESVTVAGESSPIDTESSTVGTVVEQRKANELPLNGRNVFNLIVLAPSVIPQGSSTGTPVGVNPFGWGNYQVSGSFGNQSAEYLDGQPLNIGYINLPVLIPTQDSIQEFKVQTSNLGAEWGRFAGGVTNLSTKGGTNYLHGEVYEYLRNRIFNANDYFLNATGKPRPPWVQNQFGAEGGGPLRLPKLQWTQSNILVRQLGRLPIADRATIHRNRSNRPGTRWGFLHDQRSDHGSVCRYGELLKAHVQEALRIAVRFAGNVIPRNRINPTSKALVDLWPASNSGGTVTPSGTINNFNTVARTGGNQDQVVARVDHDITMRQRLFVRFSHWNVMDLPIDPLEDGLCADRCAENYSTNAAVAAYNYNINAATILDFNASLSRFKYNRSPTNAGFDLTSIGWPASYNQTSCRPSCALPQLPASPILPTISCARRDKAIFRTATPSTIFLQA